MDCPAVPWSAYAYDVVVPLKRATWCSLGWIGEGAAVVADDSSPRSAPSGACLPLVHAPSAKMNEAAMRRRMANPPQGRGSCSQRRVTAQGNAPLLHPMSFDLRRAISRQNICPRDTRNLSRTPPRVEILREILDRPYGAPVAMAPAMPSQEHAVLVDLFRASPRLAVALLHAVGVDVAGPAH